MGMSATLKMEMGISVAHERQWRCSHCGATRIYWSGSEAHPQRCKICGSPLVLYEGKERVAEGDI